MKKKEVIIIPNELEVNLKAFSHKCKKNHIEGISKYIYQNDLSVSSPVMINSDKIAKELVDQGFIVILTDEFYNKENIKNLLIYLPEKISPNQLEYFQIKKDELIKYNLMILAKEPMDKFKIIDETTTEESILDILMHLLLTV